MKKEKQKLITKTIKNYRKFDPQKYNNDLENAPWSICEIFDDLDDQVWAWHHIFQKISSEHITTRTIRKKEGKLPWINNTIRKLIAILFSFSVSMIIVSYVMYMHEDDNNSQTL